MKRTSTTREDFETVALPYLNDLFRMARPSLGSPAEAEDIVQETYYQAWKSFHRFEPGTNCRAWLFKILFHVIHHHRRKWRRWTWVTEGEERLKDTLVYEAPIPTHLSDEEVLAAFEKLPRHYREVVLLADVEEFSYQELAEMLRIPMGTVMSRLNRGRKLLRAELASLAAGYGTGQTREAVQLA